MLQGNLILNTSGKLAEEGKHSVMERRGWLKGGGQMHTIQQTWALSRVVFAASRPSLPECLAWTQAGFVNSSFERLQEIFTANLS